MPSVFGCSLGYGPGRIEVQVSYQRQPRQRLTPAATSLRSSSKQACGHRPSAVTAWSMGQVPTFRCPCGVMAVNRLRMAGLKSSPSRTCSSLRGHGPVRRSPTQHLSPVPHLPKITSRRQGVSYRSDRTSPTTSQDHYWRPAASVQTTTTPSNRMSRFRTCRPYVHKSLLGSAAGTGKCTRAGETRPSNGRTLRVRPCVSRRGLALLLSNVADRVCPVEVTPVP